MNASAWDFASYVSHMTFFFSFPCQQCHRHECDIINEVVFIQLAFLAKLMLGHGANIVIILFTGFLLFPICVPFRGEV